MNQVVLSATARSRYPASSSKSSATQLASNTWLAVSDSRDPSLAEVNAFYNRIGKPASDQSSWQLGPNEHATTRLCCTTLPKYPFKSPIFTTDLHSNIHDRVTALFAAQGDSLRNKFIDSDLGKIMLDKARYLDAWDQSMRAIVMHSQYVGFGLIPHLPGSI